MLKKINAMLSFITALLALAHTVIMGLTMIGVIGFNPVFSVIGIALLVVFSIHIALSLIVMFFTSGDGFKYPKLNISTIEQRLSAILLLLFVHFHMNNYFANGNLVKQSVLGLVTELLFSVIIMSHFMPSLEKGLTTLGLYGKTAVTIIKIIALACFIFSIVAILIYFVGALI